MKSVEYLKDLREHTAKVTSFNTMLSLTVFQEKYINNLVPYVFLEKLPPKFEKLRDKSTASYNLSCRGVLKLIITFKKYNMRNTKNLFKKITLTYHGFVSCFGNRLLITIEKSNLIIFCYKINSTKHTAYLTTLLYLSPLLHLSVE